MRRAPTPPLLRHLVYVTAGLAALFGCGSTTSPGASMDASARDVPSATGCPVAQPTAGGSCSPEGAVCEYGDDPRPSCRAASACTAEHWTPRVGPTFCTPLPPTTCPASRAAAQGASCTPEGAYCTYESGLACTCTHCPGPQYPVGHCNPPGMTVWDCAAPDSDPQCPQAQPNLGTSCHPEGKVCDYGCEPGRSTVCQRGAWVAHTTVGGCPISTRRAKRDIVYLGTDDVARLADAVRSTRLATYAYTDPALAGRRRLGFILEDQPASFAVDPEASQVDLYGYTSMLVAAVQAQSRQIDALTRDLTALQARLDASVAGTRASHRR